MDVRTPIPTNGGDQLAKFGDDWKRQIEAARAKFGGSIQTELFPGTDPTDVPVLFVEPARIADVLAYFRDTPGFEYDFLSDITATDEEASPRFHVVYQLYSWSKFWRFRLKVAVDEGQDVPTACGVWPAANWAEREVWDMFGVKFAGHPDLRRILMDERWVGHPLRKDYPLKGYQLFTEPMVARPELLES